ncbi:hypothetical protein [Actinomadura parmotrematis]|uniref:Uncharacterized protein n=1 Tax=Actinomadura parmotrematis TaxID=2864039 RepID=A0ABS7FW54_9ACTN|nr:hypothetical protein [Actinomadura parmotrematis]MBW8484657.1 hypothetical protein [Actinomadura parmotrematis]
MSNGARHGLGLLAGVVATPALAAALFYGTYQANYVLQSFRATWDDRWLPYALLGGAAVLIALLVGTRISPLASLVPGLAFTAAGGLWAWDLRKAVDWTGGKLPHRFDVGYTSLGGLGLLLAFGLILLVASLAPSRWRGRRRDDLDDVNPLAGMEPIGPRHAASPQPSSPPSAGPLPPGYGGAGPRNAPPPLSGRDQPAEGGEWTRMFGGEDQR